MLFLIEYDRKRGAIVSQEAFDHSERDRAADARLAIELRGAGQGEQREIVLLEAETESALRVTHRRFFEDIASLIPDAPDGARSDRDP